jgi:hypothetical protein
MEVKTGDIFRASWGYEQTNIDYYVVVGVTPKMVRLQECGKRCVEDTSWASDVVVPDPDTLIGDPFLRRVVHGAVRIDKVATAVKCSPEDRSHRSWWH